MTYQDAKDAAWEAFRRFDVADHEWGKELVRVFGKQASDKRYQPVGHGKPGSALRALYVQREQLRESWEAAREIERAARPK